MEIILGIIFVVVAIIIFYIADKDHYTNDDTTILTVTSCVFGMVLFGIGCVLCADFLGFMPEHEKQPTALDVYNGKTTLEITYKDSIPVDTVVVWK